MAITTTSHRNSRSGDAEGYGHRGKGRIAARSCSTRKTADVGITIGIATAEITRHGALRGNVDAQALSNEGIDAGFHVRSIDVLTIAEQAAVGLRAGDIAATFELRETLEIATHVDVRGAGAAATRDAMVLTRILTLHGHATAILAMPFAARLGRADAIVRRRIDRFTTRDRRLIAFGATPLHAIERRGVTLRQTRRSAITRAHLRGRQCAATFTTSYEIERFTFGCTATLDFDFASEAIGIEIEVTAFRRRRVRIRGRGREQKSGQAKKRKSEFAEVRHGGLSCLGYVQEYLARVPEGAHRTRAPERRMDEYPSQSFTAERRLSGRDGDCGSRETTHVAA